MRRQNLLSQSGFSILEAMAVIAILGVLASLSYPAIKRIQTGSAEKALDSDVATMNRAVSAYLASGGSIPSTATGEQIISKLKTKVSEELRETIPGFSSSFIDPRITPHFLTAEEMDSDRARAVWDPDKRKFYTTREKGSAGIKKFSLTPDDSSSFPVMTFAEDENRSFAFQYSDKGSWIWDYEGDAVKEKSLEPTIFSTSSVSLPDSIPVSLAPPVAPPAAPAAPALVLLDPPAFSHPPGTYPIQGFNMTVDLINPNPAGISDLVYSLDFGSWQYYPGGGVTVSPDSVLKARAVPNGAGYSGSAVSEATYGASPATLLPPLMNLSGSAFNLPAVDTITVHLDHPNDPTVSRVDYRINGGPWLPFAGDFNVKAADYPAGLTIEAYTVSKASFWLDSSLVSSAIGVIASPPVITFTMSVTATGP